jgi:cytochrome c oxidase subunit 2
MHGLGGHRASSGRLAAVCRHPGLSAFHKPANPDVTATLQAAIEKINGLPQEPDFMVHTGGLSHTSKPAEFDTLDQALKGARPKQVFFVPGDSGDHWILILKRNAGGQRAAWENMFERWTLTRLYRVFTLAAVLVAAAGTACAQNPPSEGAKEFKLTAKKYEFSPNTITVKQGDKVRLTVTALDRDHGFKIEAFHVDEKLPKGEAATVEFTADQAGTFPFVCSRFCGLGHSKMRGKLVVE